MSLAISPPLSHEASVSFVKQLQALWNEGELSKLISLFANDCEWRDNDSQIRGAEEIFSYLRERKSEQLHFQVRAELWSHSFFRLAISFQSEWQHSIQDKWFRTSGHIFIRLDSIGMIKEFCLSTTGNAICVNERSIGLNP